jgi:protein SCO1
MYKSIFAALMQFKNTKYYWLLLLIPALLVVFYFVKKNEQKPLRSLPYYGPKTYSRQKDTSYHVVPDFEFTNQYGEKISQRDLANKIYVADYFFTTCQSICPIMSNQMERVAKVYRSNPDVLFLSHTVNPEDDSVSVLLDYAERHHAAKGKWHFLTGHKKELYSLARKGYLLDAEEGSGGEDDFIHTQNFALIDKERRIRGYYDGTDSSEVNRLIIDIQLLLDEYKWKQKNK